MSPNSNTADLVDWATGHTMFGALLGGSLASLTDAATLYIGTKNLRISYNNHLNHVSLLSVVFAEMLLSKYLHISPDPQCDQWQ